MNAGHDFTGVGAGQKLAGFRLGRLLVAGLLLPVGLSACSVSPNDVLGRQPGTVFGQTDPASDASRGPEPDQTPVRLELAPQDRLIAAVEAHDCVLTATNVEAILLAANLTQADLETLVPELAENGRATVSGEGVIRIHSSRCV
ncbi:MAG: hypothetical protein JKX69_06185 [Rhodobacteraceae bacterium]|nr:hypothetical protein [Paracoccaceae bacterium]